MLNYAELAATGLSYHAFLDRYANPEQRRRWDSFYESVTLSPAQMELLRTFKREMHVFVSAGAWCGDCVNQCPIFAKVAAHSDKIKLLFFDRDDAPQFTSVMKVCGGQRVPAVLFLSEDFTPVGRYGDRTLAKYRDIASSLEGVMCPTGLFGEKNSLQDNIIAEWVDQFERNQLILRTSSRLRAKHSD